MHTIVRFPTQFSREERKLKNKRSILFSLVIILCMLALPGLSATAHDLPQWTQGNPVH
jgi:hypothetical protein